MNPKVLVSIIVILIIAIPLASNVFYTVREDEQVVITQFGEAIRTTSEAGLKIKTPFIQKVQRLEKRILEWDGSPNEITTKDKRFIWLDTTARWRITNALTFYERFRGGNPEALAQSRLDDIIDSAARDLVTGQLLVEVARNSDRILDLNLEELDQDEGGGSTEQLESISVGRDTIVQMILEKAQQSIPQDWGIELVDVRIKRINYVESVRREVFAQMISERDRIAAKYRSEGQGEAADIMGQKQKELERIQSEAYQKAEQLRGDADAQAIQIYAQSHGRDPEFFAFLQTLETYRKTINANTKLILSTDSDLYNYLKDAGLTGRR
ncbi:protease modulator HflC [Candidatus Poribacteria bacterium]|nr:MAG: protease modulator HflC [Candidatus Poribacteria bacterium]